ncbi:unnamed protein product [Kluyveromyces dobzhanskii CBS 2104]|uniref:WGS project CCBQ000000000 data, contig 00106 n=1 Tax=Kluyveromyces dobzhanskii CBS 2104 TaxID=1427455 RepID=A0A0A8L671_9SACH|nr:unnamed protein product [Kluyveromyces dobzhanskii CBS 2104]
MFRSKKLKTVSNAIKSVATRDASNGISSKAFELSEVSRYGMNGKVSTFAFDPVQSLLAIATDSGEIHVYGKQQVEVVFTLEVKTIKEMRFVKGIYLIVVDSKDSLNVLSLHQKVLLASFFAPGKITCIETDPSLSWVLIGLQSGSTIIYDIDRDYLSPFKIENLQKSRYFKRDHLSAVLSLQWNPRDIGTVLISYDRVTVLYSFVENDVKQHFIHEVEGKVSKVLLSVFHPNGLNIMTVHDGNCLVFWDSNSGQKIVSRHLLDEGPIASSTASTNVFQVAWIQEKDESSTSLLFAGGSGDLTHGEHSLTLINLGPTPLYSVTSYDKMASFYTQAVGQKIVPVPNDASVIKFLPLANGDPYYAGNYAPSVILVLLDDGEIETLLYPSGNITYKASLFPQSISWIRPAATTSFATSVPKKTWLGMMSATYNRDYILKGGYPAKKTLRVHDSRSALSTGHTNGSVRIWDASHGELDESSVFDVNVSHSLNTSQSVAVDHISYAGETAELAVSIESGDVVLYKFQVNEVFTSQKDAALEMNFRRFSLNDKPHEVLVDIRDRAPNNIREGFMPISAVHARKGRVTSLCNSNVGFVALSYEDGTLIVIDRRGPAIIYMDNISKISKIRSCYISELEFTIMEYGEDGYSSILLVCGTDAGEILLLKIIPDPSGRFTVQPYDALKATDDGPVVSLATFSKDTGSSCRASIPRMQQLSKGVRVPGQIIVSGRADIRLVTPGKSKDTHKIFKYPIANTGLSIVPFTNPKNEKIAATVLVAVLINGEIKVLSLPELKEIKSFAPLANVQSKYIKESSVLINGDVIYRVNKTEAWLLTVVRKNSNTIESQVSEETDSLYNPNLRIKCRPYYNTLQWVRGSIYCKPEDLDSLLGNRRPEAKYEEEKIAKGTISLTPDEKTHNTHDLSADGRYQYQAPVRHGAKSGGYGPMRSISRAVQNGMDSIEDTFNDYATAANETMNEAIEQTGKDLMKGAINSKIGL